jgi:cytochrome c biogenesis protein CcmG/thiol:disulfide interchange protein DsbE
VNGKVLAVGGVLSLPLLGILLVGLGRDPHQMSSPLVGQKAPGFTLRPVGGGPAVSLEGLRGKPVVLNFWATWCGPCLDEHPALTEGAAELGQKAVFLGVVYEDDAGHVQDFLKRNGGAYPSLLDEDGKTAIAYGVYGVPETFFIAPDGTIADKYVGSLTPLALRGFVQKAGAAR